MENNTIKIVAFSDTHKKRFDIKESGDILIFAGDDDICNITELMDFIHWINRANFEHKIVVAGNHDFYFQESKYAKECLKSNNIIYLEDSYINICGIKIYGTPYTPTFFDWAFMESEKKLENRFSNIPEDVDILITHGPARGVLDQVNGNGVHAGSFSLSDRIKNLSKLKYHLFGHIHGSYGSIDNKFFNVSVNDEKYFLKNKPQIIFFDKK